MLKNAEVKYANTYFILPLGDALMAQWSTRELVAKTTAHIDTRQG